jgi:Tfp pilus assembly protein PilX
MMQYQPKYKNKQGGFTLFFAVMAVSIVISIGITLSIIALKETSLAGIRRESQLAYYAAESGTSCATYYLLEALKTNSAPTSITMECNYIPGVLNSQMVYNFGSQTGVSITKTFDFEAPYLYTASTTLTRLNNGVSWDIASEGFNRRGLATVKLLRSQKINITGSSTGSANDVMILVDHSGSICMDNPKAWENGVYYPSRERQNCEYHVAMRNSVLKLIDLINPDPTSISANRLGMITFAGVGQQVNGNSNQCMPPYTSPCTADQKYNPDFGKPKLQAHLNATTTTLKNIIQRDASNYLRISYNDGTNLADPLRIAACELTGKALNAANYESDCTTSDPNPANDPVSTNGTHDRPDNNYPDTVILFTDGANNVYNNNGTRVELEWTNVTNACSLAWEQVIAQAQALKAAGIKIIVVGVGDQMNTKACGGTLSATQYYKEVRVSVLLQEKIASNKQYYYVDTYNEGKLIDTFNKIVRSTGLSIKVIE